MSAATTIPYPTTPDPRRRQVGEQAFADIDCERCKGTGQVDNWPCRCLGGPSYLSSDLTCLRCGDSVHDLDVDEEGPFILTWAEACSLVASTGWRVRYGSELVCTWCVDAALTATETPQEAPGRPYPYWTTAELERAVPAAPWAVELS